MRRTFGPSRGNRKPPQTTTSAPQKGGGVVHAPPEITTVHNNGTVTTSGYPTERAARHAKKAAQSSKRRVHRIVRETTPSPQTRSQRPASYSPPKQPAPATSTPKKFQGAPTAGTPTLGELKSSKAEGTLKANKRGYLTTPKVRKASQGLAKAKQAVSKSGAKLTGPLVPEQKRFVKGVAKHTHLPVRGIAAQALAEQSGSAAANYEASGEHNYLNIGPGQHFGSNKEAVRETSHLLNTGPSYAGIRSTRGKGGKAYTKAVAASPWGTVGSTMAATLGEVGAKRGNPKAAKRLQQAESNAEAAGLNVKGVKGHPSPKVVKAFKKAVKTMGAIDSKHFEYVWGGGHGTFSGPFDCSGAVSAMIHSVAPGAIPAPLTSGSMGSALKPGPGAITVFYNSVHTFAYIPSLHKYWGTSESNPGGGAGYFPKSVGDSEVASGNSAGSYSVGHVPGLGKKVALQMGGALSFPGMTVSPSGTTATINPGSGATVQSPGFSTKPIKLTRAQKARRTLHKLDELGVGVSPSQSPPSTPDSKTLKALEAKYGVR